MKKSLISPVGLTATGMGPRIMGFAIPFILTAIALDIWFPELTRIFGTQTPLQTLLGASITGLGVLIWVIAIVQFSRAFPKGKLITTGTYRISRNPIYAAWVVLILPGLALLDNNLWFLAAAASMYIAMIRLVGEEEKHLRRIFRHQYLLYCEKVGKVGFLPFLIWK